MPRILLVEDNPLNRDMLSRRLLRRGFQVIMAVDGLEALALAQADTPDLILMDMSLPKLDGWDASYRLKSDSKTSSIPIIALTAHAMDGDRDKALAVGCDDFVTKPLEFEALIHKMDLLLAENQQRER